MASLKSRNGNYSAVFYWGGKQFTRSLETDDKEEANELLGRLKLQIRAARNGSAVIPPNADPIEWLMSAGKRTESADGSKSAVRTVAELLDRYVKAALPDAKAATTFVTEQVHHKHLNRVLGSRTPVLKLTLATLQRYVASRAGDGVTGQTIKKEIASLRVAWNYGVSAGLVSERALPVKGLRYPRHSEKPPFRTKAEIEAIIGRGAIDEDSLWDSLFLSMDEVRSLVSWADENSPNPWFSVAVAVAAWTGCRRSELCRIEVADVDLSGEVLTLRERKRDTTKKETTRQVQIGPSLKRVLAEHLERGESRRWLLEFRGKQTNPEQLRDQWRRLREGSAWDVVTGFHVLRHSFISNCAARGVSQAIIDGWVGHQTDEQRKRYRHLFPAERRRAIESLEGPMVG